MSRIPHGTSPVETRQAFQRMEARVSDGSDPGHSHTGASLSGIDISDDTNLAATAPVVLTGDTLSLNQLGVDHGSIGGLAGDDHAQYHTDIRGDARYFRENEHLASSAGVADAGKPIVLDAAGHVDATMINDGDVDHGSIGGLGDDDHTIYLLADGTRNLTGNLAVDAGITIDGRDISVDGAALDAAVAASHAEIHAAISHSDITSTGAVIEAAVALAHAEAHSVVSHNDTTGTGAELNTLTDNSMADVLHRHSELSASDGTPDATLAIDADGAVTIGGTLGVTGAISGPNVSSGADPGHTHTAYDELVDRGDPADWDFSGVVPAGGADFTCDSTERELDLSSIVPEGAYAVSIMFSCSSSAKNHAVFFFATGMTNTINVIQVYTQAAATVMFGGGWVKLDANRKISYWANVDATLNFTVRGWFI